MLFRSLVSPIPRLDAEATPNRLGATLADLRAAFESVVRERIAAGDGQLALVPGAALVPAEELPDGIHPDDRGHARIAEAVGVALSAQLRAASV